MLTQEREEKAAGNDWPGRLNADWLLRYVTQGVNADWLSSRECRGKVQIFQLQPKCRAANPRERARRCQGKMLRRQSNLVAGFSSNKFRLIRVSTLTLYGIVSPCRVWCEHQKKKLKLCLKSFPIHSLTIPYIVFMI